MKGAHFQMNLRENQVWCSQCKDIAYCFYTSLPQTEQSVAGLHRSRKNKTRRKAILLTIMEQNHSSSEINFHGYIFWAINFTAKNPASGIIKEAVKDLCTSNFLGVYPTEMCTVFTRIYIQDHL